MRHLEKITQEGEQGGPKKWSNQLDSSLIDSNRPLYMCCRFDNTMVNTGRVENWSNRLDSSRLDSNRPKVVDSTMRKVDCETLRENYPRR